MVSSLGLQVQNQKIATKTKISLSVNVTKSKKELCNTVLFYLSNTKWNFDLILDKEPHEKKTVANLLQSATMVKKSLPSPQRC